MMKILALAVSLVVVGCSKQEPKAPAPDPVQHDIGLVCALDGKTLLLDIRRDLAPKAQSASFKQLLDDIQKGTATSTEFLAWLKTERKRTGIATACPILEVNDVPPTPQ